MKLLFGLAVVGVVIALAVHFMKSQHDTSPAPGGPVVVNVNVPNPLGGGQPSSGDKVYVP